MDKQECVEWLEARGITQRSQELFQLGYDEQRNAVSIPYLNALGEIRAMRYRNFDREPKYIWTKGSGIHLFYPKATKQSSVWICEGEFDSILMNQMGYPTVGVPGVTSFKKEWRFLFAYCQRVTIVFDGDDAGRQGAQKLAGWIGPYVPHITTAKLPDGKDVTDLYLEDKQHLIELL